MRSDPAEAPEPPAARPRSAGAPARVVPFHDRYPIPTRMYRQYLVDRLLRRLDLPERPWVLDIGCGAGDFLARHAPWGFRGLGIDLDPTSVAIARERLRDAEGLEAHRMDLMEVGGSFDLVFAFSVFEHILDDAAAFGKVSSLLREEGRFILSVPARPELFGDVDRAYGHVRRYEKASLLRKLSAAGLAAERFWSWGPAIFSRIYRCFARKGLQADAAGERAAELTRHSGHGAPLGAGFIRLMHPLYSRLFWVLKVQNLFLESGFLNCNYLVCARRQAEGAAPARGARSQE